MVYKRKHTRKRYLRLKLKKNKSRRNRTSRGFLAMNGGNYETDTTSITTDGIPTKQLNKFVVAVDGITMSGTAYKKLQETKY